MMNKHPDDLAIQNYLWDRSKLSADDLHHMQTCDHCIARAEDYRLLFKAVETSPKPAFDFDLAALVIPQLEQLHQKETTPVAPPIPAAIDANLPRTWSWPAIAAIVCVALCIGIPVYLFKDELLEIVFNASFMITWLIVMMVALIAVFLGIDEYRKYNQRINSLDIR